MDFPIPRRQLPSINVSREERAAVKKLVTTLLQHTVQEFEKFAYKAGSVVDTSTQWKHVTTRDQLRLYRERHAGALTAHLAFSLDHESVLPRGSTIDVLATPSMLLTGYVAGRVENVMHAVVTNTQQELALLLSFLYEDVADCGVLHTIETPQSAEQTHHSLGYRYFVRKAPTSSLIKYRDTVYIEFTGMTTTSTGESLSFHIMHSAELRAFPDLSVSSSVRATQSLRYLYRQKNDAMVEVFCLGNLDIGGSILKSISAKYEAETMFACTRLVDCAEARRLTQMELVHKQRSVDNASNNYPLKKNECSICRHKKLKFAAAAFLTNCDTCGHAVCSRCRLSKKVFVEDTEKILGKFVKVSCCKTCVLIASSGQQICKYSSSILTRTTLSSNSSSMALTDSIIDQVTIPDSNNEDDEDDLRYKLSEFDILDHPAIQHSKYAVPPPTMEPRSHRAQSTDRPSNRSRGRDPKSAPSRSRRSQTVVSADGRTVKEYLPAELVPSASYQRTRSYDSDSRRHRGAVAVHSSGFDYLVRGRGNSTDSLPTPFSMKTHGPPPLTTSVSDGTKYTSVFTSEQRMELFARMVELNEAAQSCYKTTKETSAAFLPNKYNTTR